MSAPGRDDPTAGGQPPSEEELRAAYEEELSRITAGDMIVQATVSLLNVGAYRLGPPAGAGEESSPPEGTPARDLEQVRDAIDAAGALLKVLDRRIPARELAPLRDALSRLQMAYAREAPATPAASAEQGEAARPAAESQTPAADPVQDPSKPGPAEASGRLWVPGR